MNRRAFLTSTISAALLSSVANGIDRCFIDDTCDQPTPGQPPVTPPVPPGPGPVPSGIYTSLVGAFDMNKAASNDQFYTVGWASCPNGYHDIWAADAMQDGVIRYGGYHKLITQEGPDAIGNATIALVKSQEGLGEIFKFTPDALRIDLELMDWVDNSWYRILKDEHGQPGLLWAKLDRPGQYVIEVGSLDYHRCVEPRGPNGPTELFEQHPAYAMNRLHGPYDISTSDGMARARSELGVLRNPHNPEGVPDVWKTFGAQLGHPNAHSMLYLMEGLWGPRDSRRILDESHWGNKELYAYIEVVEPNNSWRRGLGLVAWVALDEPDYQYSGNWATYRQHIQTTVKGDGRTRLLQTCENPHQNAANATMGLSMMGNRYRNEEFLIIDGIEKPRMPNNLSRKPRGILR